METYVIRRLEQARLLSDPFKLKLLEQFAAGPATTKQVADELGEKAPRLYRHVDALVDEGLLELVEERPKRGTVERYFRTIASRFEVDPELFTTGSAAEDDAFDMIRSVLRETESELVRLFEHQAEQGEDGEQAGIFMRMAIKGTPEEIEQLNDKLSEWLEECNSIPDDRADTSGLESYAALLAFYPRIEES